MAEKEEGTLMMNLLILTSLVCPIRWMRITACSSTAGFHHGSYTTQFDVLSTESASKPMLYSAVLFDKLLHCLHPIRTDIIFKGH